VVAVEPLPEMRALIEGVEALDGTAEAMPLPDGFADAVVAAQAFHWFDYERALPELHRVLKEDGRLGLIWNSRDLDDPLQREVERLLAPIRGSAADQRNGAWREPLAASPLFGPVEERSFRHELAYTADDLCARVASTSFVAALPPIEREALLVRVRALTAGLREPFPFVYRTDVYVTARTR
jgi:SAM-dependent methyltransferase